MHHLRHIQTKPGPLTSYKSYKYIGHSCDTIVFVYSVLNKNSLEHALFGISSDPQFNDQVITPDNQVV